MRFVVCVSALLAVLCGEVQVFAQEMNRVISLRKSGGDKLYLTAEKDKNNELIARAASVGEWEQFLLVAHPSGGVALKALSNGLYLQVADYDATVEVRARGQGMWEWEQFTILNKGTNLIALKSSHTGKWLQASYRVSNSLVYPAAAAALTWETFEWRYEDYETCTDTRGLQACVDSMSSRGGGTVMLNTGSYLLAKSLQLKDNVNIVGQGYNSVITFDSSVRDTIDEPLLYSTAVNNIQLKDFKLRCYIDQDPNSSDLRNDHMGFFLEGSGDPSTGEATSNNNIYMERVEAMYCSNGMHLKGVTGITAVDLKLHNNGNTEVDLFHNIYFRRVANLRVIQTSSSSGGYYTSPRGHGIRGGYLKNVYFGGLAVYSNADHGIHLNDVIDVRLHDLDVHDNCANPSGACGSIKCYGSCDIDYDAAEE